MKNLIVANLRENGKVREQELRSMVRAQVENSLSLGWKSADLYVVTNMEIREPATIIRAPLNASCLTGSKMFALEHLFSLGLIQEGEVWWAHDLDAWQNCWFDAPEILDIALAEYSFPRFNGGSVFLRAPCRDLVGEITRMIRDREANREEPAINRILRQSHNRVRTTTLNSTFNVGCTNFAVRYARSTQPIFVAHFHPTSKRGWRIHVGGSNPLGKVSVTSRLTEILIRHFHNGVGPSEKWLVKPTPKQQAESR